jgi:hypothetical protein
LLTALFSAFTLTAFAQSTHDIRSTTGLAVKDAQTGCWYSVFSGFRAATSWTEPTPGYPAAAHFRGVTKAGGTVGCATGFYEFALLKVASTSADEIDGVWEVKRNGAVVCGGCNGKAYGLSQPAGPNYYKVYVDDPAFPGTEDWLYSGYISSRFDF